MQNKKFTKMRNESRAEWAAEWAAEWVTEWVAEWVIECVTEYPLASNNIKIREHECLALEQLRE